MRKFAGLLAHIGPALVVVVVVFPFFAKQEGKVGEVLGAMTNAPARGLPQSLTSPKTPVASVVPELKATSALVYDKHTGEILMQKNPDEQVGIASITKLMTGLLAIEDLDLKESFTVTEKDILNINPVLGLRPEAQILGSDLFMAMLVGSANDAALMLGRLISEKHSGAPIADIMNERARSLGMGNTHYQNPVGFDSTGHHSTARDVYILTEECLRHGAFELVAKQKEVRFADSAGKTYRVRATNRLIAKNVFISALKTGFTGEAQGAMVTQAEVGDFQAVIIVLRSPDREGDTLKLLESIKQMVK